MPRFALSERLTILSDSAHDDAVCASSRTPRRDIRDGGKLGSTEGSGICHTYLSDDHGISLLKTLITSFYNSDDAFCINRTSINAQRARFSVDLAIAFCRRNDVERLLSSSGVIHPENRMMENTRWIGAALKKVNAFIAAHDWSTCAPTDTKAPRARLAPPRKHMSLF
jgi:predicted DNA-binding helix-hairpin-helix protein